MKKQRREVESEERRYNCAKVSRKKIHRREMLGKSRNAVFFNDLGGLLGKAAGAEVAVVARSALSIKMCLSLHVRTTF